MLSNFVFALWTTERKGRCKVHFKGRSISRGKHASLVPKRQSVTGKLRLLRKVAACCSFTAIF